jgi:hypothetical protein
VTYPLRRKVFRAQVVAVTSREFLNCVPIISNKKGGKFQRIIVESTTPINTEKTMVSDSVCGKEHGMKVQNVEQGVAVARCSLRKDIREDSSKVLNGGYMVATKPTDNVSGKSCEWVQTQFQIRA